MPTALELLSTEACDDILTVDLESRTIIIPKNVSVLGVEADDETRILHFCVPRYYCEVDLSEFLIRINYKNAKNEGDMYIVTDAVIEDDVIKFDWVVGRHAFTKKGNVVFNVCLKDVFEGIVRREFNTTVAILPVLEGLETGDEIVEEHLDIFEQLREELSSDLGDLASTAVNEYVAEHKDELKGPQGDAFEYEDFTAEQLESLKGPKGDAFEYEDFTPEQLESLKGPQGDAFEYEDFTAEQLAKLVGPSGSSIKSINRTSGTGAPGTTDTYTVTLTDDSTTTFKVYNGANGEGAGDMTTQVYDPQGKARDIFKYVDDVVGSSGFPNLGENITEGSGNDTVSFWAEKGSGQAWFSANGMLVNQPDPYGFVISYVHGTDVFQMFSDQTNGVTYFRYGDNINDWFKHWTAMELPGMATTTKLGLVMVNGNNGIGVNTENGNLYIRQASNSEIDGKEHSYKPITPANLDYAVKAALTNNANELSDTERTSVLDWIGAISKLCVQKESGDITDLLGTESCRYIIGSDVTGMPTNDKWWFVDVLSNGYTDLIVIATSVTSTPVQYVRTCVNNEWGEWHQVPITNADGELIINGNIKGVYTIGEWLQTTTTENHRTDAAEKIAVLDGSGWVYYRTPAEIRSDINAYSKTEVDNAIATAIGNAIGGSY